MNSAPSRPRNKHQSVMFEISAKDETSLMEFYEKVFGWAYEKATGGFAYVHFPLQSQPLLGGIGQADAKIPGFEVGHRFYLLVDDLQKTIDAAIPAGGAIHMHPTEVDGYKFALIKDPEGNVIGLIEPFET
jgi:uncharacterized protein